MNDSPHRQVSQARSFRRSAVELECSIYAEVYGAAVSLVGRDLSERGVWLETDLPLDIGTKVGLSFQLPQTEQTLYINGLVRHIKLFRRTSDPQRAGMGIEFTTLRAIDRKLLSENLHRLGRNRYRALTEEPTVVGTPLNSVNNRERRARSRDTAVGAALTIDTEFSASERRTRRSSRGTTFEPSVVPDKSKAFAGGLALAVRVLRGTDSTQK